jgi:large subunit ribosomal protein L33
VGEGGKEEFFQMAAPARVIITLECTTCKERNYSTTKNKRANAEKLELSKFCKRCRKHQRHKETK